MKNFLASINIWHIYHSNQALVSILIMLLGFYPFLRILKSTIFVRVTNFINTKTSKYNKILKKHNIGSYITTLLIVTYVLVCSNIIQNIKLLPPALEHIKDVIVKIYSTIAMAYIIIGVTDIFSDICNEHPIAKKLQVYIYFHIVKVLVVIFCILIVISKIFDVSISSIITSIGAATAILTLIFKDVLLGLVSSLQLTFQDIIRVGDWITVPGANGTIERITITVVTVKNFDNTISMVPTHTLFTTGLKNSRGIFEAEARRIKKAINMDVTSIRILSKYELEDIKSHSEIKNFCEYNPEFFIEGNSLTNLALFRHYAYYYLKNNDNILKEFLLSVYISEPTPTGIPIEILGFANRTDWVGYSEIQTKIMEHFIGMLPVFKLRSFQYKY